MGTDPNMSGQLATLDRARVRGEPAPPRHRLHRPVPDAPAAIPTPTSTRRSARCPTSCTRARCATSAARRSRRRRSSRRSGWRSAATASASCASSRRTRSSSAASRPTCCRRASATAWRSSRGARSPAGGCRAGGARAPTTSPATAPTRIPTRYDLSLPGNQHKLEAADALAAARRRRRDLARAPRGRVGAATTRRSRPRSSARGRWSSSRRSSAPPTSPSTTTLLDRIDEIVPPGTNFTWADAGYPPPMVADPRARRRQG